MTHMQGGEEESEPDGLTRRLKKWCVAYIVMAYIVMAYAVMAYAAWPM